MPLSPPMPAQAGQPFFLQFAFFDFESGVLTDPISVQLDLTYGEEAGAAPDIAGPFTYTGASTAAPGTIWRTGTGQFTFWWQVPGGLLPGVYVASWTAGYGSLGDEFVAMENFPILSGAPFIPVTSGDLGYWTGSLSYQPPWSPSPLAIQFGQTDGNGITWLWQKLDGWDSPPSVGSVLQRSADHGGWPAAQYYGPRILTLTVEASAPTQALRDVARGILQQAVPVGTTSTDLAVLAYDEPVPKQAQVRRNAGAAITEACPTLTDVVFTIPLVAPDPRKYATTPQQVQVVLPAPVVSPLALPFTSGFPVAFPGGFLPEASSAVVTNAGTFETRPQLTVNGPVTSPAIVNATLGSVISFTGLIMGASDVLTVDTDNKQTFLNGLFYPADPQSSWWVLSPGDNTVYLSGVTSAGAQLSISWSSAWI
jgi:hypothetical protein